MTRLLDLVKAAQAVGDSLTSSQSFGILDAMLENGLVPLERETTAFREWAAEILHDAASSRRRPNPALMVACMSAALGRPGASRMLVSAGVDRGHVFSFLGRATGMGTALRLAHVDHHRRHGQRVPAETVRTISRVRQELGTSPRVEPACRQASYWLRHADSFKESIVHHYLRLLYKNASRSSIVSGGRVERDDAFSTAYLATYGAVDRFQSSRGAFGTYLGKWLMAANREAASHSLGLAAPGRRVRSGDAPQAVVIDDAVDVHDHSHGSPDFQTATKRIDVVAMDPDIRAALWLSELVPPAARDPGIGRVNNQTVKQRSKT